MALSVESDRPGSGRKGRSLLRSPLARAAVWSGLMIAGSSIPRLPAAPPPLLHYDKVLHLIEYGVFAWLWGDVVRGAARARLRRYAFAIVVCGGFLWGALDEVYQGTRGRSRDIHDWMADAVAIVAAQSIQERRRSKRRTV